MLLWGQPEVTLYCETRVASWQAGQIQVLLASTQNQGSSLQSPVTAVAFTQRQSAHWIDQLRNEAIHDCDGVQTERLHIHPGWG
jgi:hypothetical protein